MARKKTNKQKEYENRYNYVSDGTARFYYGEMKNPRTGNVGSAYTLPMYHNQIRCYCGNPGKNCTCVIDEPPELEKLYPRKSEQWMRDIRPMLLFTIKHRKNRSFVYSFFSKDYQDAIDEVTRLNSKKKSNYTTETGFYLDDSGFDDEFNKDAIKEYQDTIKYRRDNNITDNNERPKKYVKQQGGFNNEHRRQGFHKRNKS